MKISWKDWTQKLGTKVKALLKRWVYLLIRGDKRKPWLKYLLLFLVFALYLFVGGERNLINYLRLQSQYNSLKEEYEQERTNYEQDSLRITQSKGGASEIERLARERYYMKEEGEDIYLIKPDTSPPPPSAP